MRKFIKAGLAVSLALVMTISQATTIGFAANGNNGNGNGNAKGNVVRVQAQVTEQAKTELRERLRVMITIGGGTWDGIPEGMAKKGYLPYGLAKRYMNGNFPYGLLKRMPNFQFGQLPTDQVKADWKLFDSLIASAEAKANTANSVNYAPNAIEKLKQAIIVAKTFKSNNPSATEKQIKAAYDALNLAIKLFDDSEILTAQSYFDNLKVILANLEAYKAKYYEKLSAGQKTSLDNLITDVKKYTKETPEVLLRGVYNDLLKRAEAFKDHLERLKELILEAETLIYVNPTATPQVRKPGLVGTNAGQYQEISVIELENAILTAKNFVAAYTNQSVNLIETRYNALQKAIDKFKLDVILGTGAMDTFKLLLAELKVYFENNYHVNNNPLVELKNYINEMQLIVDNPTVYPLTQAKFNYYFDKGETYIEDLYDAAKDALIAKINEAKALINAFVKTYPVVEDQNFLKEKLDAMVAAVAAAEAKIVLGDYKYADLTAHFNSVQASIAGYQMKEAELKLRKTLDVAGDKIDKYDSVDFSGYDESNLVNVKAAYNALVAKVAVVNDYLDDPNEFETSELTIMESALVALINDLVAKADALSPKVEL